MVNNEGDPFESSDSAINTKLMERNVLDYYASLWHAKWLHNESDMESYWGYLHNMGSTEGKIHATWNAYRYLSGEPIKCDTLLSLVLIVPIMV